jgi:hypothetical protein
MIMPIRLGCGGFTVQIWVFPITTLIIPIFIGTPTIRIIGEQVFTWGIISGGVLLGATIPISIRPTIIRIITDRITVRTIIVRIITGIIRIRTIIAEIIITTVMIKTAVIHTDIGLPCKGELQA